MTSSDRVEDGWSSQLAVMIYILKWLVSARLPVSSVHKGGWEMWLQDLAVQGGKGVEWWQICKQNALWIKIIPLHGILTSLQSLPVLTSDAQPAPDPSLTLAAPHQSLPSVLQLRLRETLPAIFIQTLWAWMVVCPTHKTGYPGSSHAASFELGIGFGSLPWVWSRNPQGTLSGHFPLAPRTTNPDSKHCICWAEATLPEQCQVSPERHSSYVPGLAYPMQPECLN